VLRHQRLYTAPLGPLGFDIAQHRQTLRPTVDGTKCETLGQLCQDEPARYRAVAPTSSRRPVLARLGSIRRARADLVFLTGRKTAWSFLPEVYQEGSCWPGLFHDHGFSYRNHLPEPLRFHVGDGTTEFMPTSLWPPSSHRNRVQKQPALTAICPEEGL